MELDNSVMIDLWDLISDNVANNKKDDLAIKFVTILAREGVEKRDFNSVRGEDEYLDAAVDHYFSDEDDGYEMDYEDE